MKIRFFKFSTLFALILAVVGSPEAQSKTAVDDELKNEFIDIVTMTGKIFSAERKSISLAKQQIAKNDLALAELDKKLFENLLNTYRKGVEHAHMKGDPNKVQIEFKATEPFFDEARTVMDEIVSLRLKNAQQQKLMNDPMLEVHALMVRPRMKNFIRLLINAPDPKTVDLYVMPAVQQYMDQTPAGEVATMMSPETAAKTMQDAVNYILEFVKIQKD